MTERSNIFDVLQQQKIRLNCLRDQISMLPSHIFHKCNPYEIKNNIFVSRGGLKLYELDKQFNLIQNNMIITDLCGGPGGFIDYILYKVAACKVCKFYNYIHVYNNYVCLKRYCLFIFIFDVGIHSSIILETHFVTGIRFYIANNPI